MNRQLSSAEINHLRRLLGWVRCEVGQSPDEMRETYKKIAAKVDVSPDDAAKARMMKSYQESVRVPAYIRQAIKSLSKILVEHDGNIIDAEEIGRQRYLRGTQLRIGK